GQVGIGLPVLEGLPDRRAHLGWVALQGLGPGGQVGLEPVAGLGPPASLGRIVEWEFILAQAAAGPRRGAGGVVTVAGLRVVRQGGLFLESFLPEASRGDVESLLGADLSQGQRLVGTCWLVLALEESRDPALELDQASGLAHML